MTVREFKQGDKCSLRDSKPGELIEGQGQFPITLVSKADVGIKDAWWADDASGRRLWFVESDLVIIDEKQI